MCSAIDFPLYMSHDLFTYKRGKLHTAGGLMTKFYVRWLFNRKWLLLLYCLPACADNTLCAIYCLGKALQAVHCVCERGLFTVGEQLYCESGCTHFHLLGHQMFVLQCQV